MTTLTRTKVIFSLLLIFWILTSPVTSFAQMDDAAQTKQKAEFIVEIANSIEHEHASLPTYRIAVYGRGRSTKSLFVELERQTAGTRIHGKSVEVRRFKKASDIEEVDILYLPANSDIKLAKIDSRMSEYPYLLITENFPFGTSAVNFALDDNNELYYELETGTLEDRGMEIKSDIIQSEQRVSSSDSWKKKFEKAMVTIDEQGNLIDNQDELIDSQERTIGTQEMVMDAQDRAIDKHEDELVDTQEELMAKDDVIRLQWIFLILTVIGVLITTVISFLAIRANKARKRALELVYSQKEEIERNHALVEKSNRNIIKSINYAKRIQTAILPSDRRLAKMLPNSFVFYEPKDIIGGDFYWIQKHRTKIFFAVADCTGHGVPGAMLSVLCSNWLTQTVKENRIHDPGMILDMCVTFLDSRLSAGESQIKDGMDIGLCVWDIDSNIVSFAGAMNSLYHVRNGEINEIAADRQPVGKHVNREPFNTHEVKLQDGDRFYLYSDGYMDQFGGPRGKKMTSLGFKALIESMQDLTMEEQSQRMHAKYFEWKGDKEQIDDVCVMGVQL